MITNIKANQGLLAGVNKRYNDREICGLEGIQIRQQLPVKKTVKKIASLYPNPASESATLEYHLETDQVLHFQLFNTIGKQMTMVKLKGNRGREQINTSQLSPGVYHYRIVAGSAAIAFGKLVIVR